MIKLIAALFISFLLAPFQPGIIPIPFGACSNPSAISGTLTCTTSSTSQLSDATAGGTWSSSATAVATIGTAGLVTGVSAGTATISYTVTGGCRATATFTVTSAGAPITFITGGFAGSTGTVTTTSAINATGGNLIIVGVTRQKTPYVSNVTDSRGNIYTLDETQDNVAGIDLWRCYTTNVSSSMTITATSGIFAVGLYYFIFSGAVGSTVDGHNGVIGSGTTANAGSTAITASANGAVYIAAVNDFNASAPTIGSSFIIPAGCSNAFINNGSVIAYAGAMAYYIQPTASALNPVWNFGSSIAYSSILACYE